MHVGRELQTFHFSSYSALGPAPLLPCPSPLRLAFHIVSPRPGAGRQGYSLTAPEEKFSVLFARIPRLQSWND